MEIGEPVSLPAAMEGEGEDEESETGAQSKSWIEITVWKSTGEPHAGVSCEIIWDGGSVDTVTTGENGSFKLDDKPSPPCTVKFPTERSLMSKDRSTLTDSEKERLTKCLLPNIVYHVLVASKVEVKPPDKVEVKPPKNLDVENVEYALTTGYHYHFVPAWPYVVVDGHMHIMSGNCMPLAVLVPFAKEKAPDFIVKESRSALNDQFEWSLIEMMAGRVGATARKTTYVIGLETVKENDRWLAKQVHGTTKRPARERGRPEWMRNLGIDVPSRSSFSSLGVSMVLTVDQDYAHLDGYWGEPVYTKVDGKWGNWERKSGERDAPRRFQEVKDRKELAGLNKGPATIRERSLWKKPGRDTWEQDAHEPFPRQLHYTDLSVVIHPFRLLPMYHYEPRRYRTSEEDETGWKYPFENELVKSGGLYLGFKMYTPYGYRPTDFERLPHLKDYFEKCAKDGIPVMTHCTPAGTFTHQRRLFIDLEEDESEKDRYVRPDGKRLVLGTLDDAKLRYFKEKYVHPEVWRPLLEQLPDLRLCVAHFASDLSFWDRGQDSFWGRPLQTADGQAVLTADGKVANAIDNGGLRYEKSWTRSMTELCETYEHFYTDISSFPMFRTETMKKFRKTLDAGDKDLDAGVHPWYRLAAAISKHPVLLHKIVFGTDWYTTLTEKLDYQQWMDQMHQGLKRIQASLRAIKSSRINPDVDLFHQFAIINPFRFYRIADQAEDFRDALRGWIARDQRTRRQTDAVLNRQIEERYELVRRVGILMGPVNDKMDAMWKDRKNSELEWGISALPFGDYKKPIEDFLSPTPQNDG